MLYSFNALDIQLIQYLNDNSCTDGSLKGAIFMFLDTFSHDKSVLATGFSFAFLSFLSDILIFCCFGPGRKCLAGRMETFKEPPKFERKLTSINDNIKDRYNGFVQRTFTRRGGAAGGVDVPPQQPSENNNEGGPGTQDPDGLKMAPPSLDLPPPVAPVEGYPPAYPGTYPPG